jgi:elongation factor 1-gamma
MSKLTILSYPNNPRVWKAQIAAKYANVNVDVPADFQFGEHNKNADYIRNCHPIGKVPVLQTPEGYIFESNAIARYVARLDKVHNLYGRNAFEAAQVDMWLDFTVTEIEPAANAWVGPVLGFVPYVKEHEEKAIEVVQRALSGLDQQLETRTFLVGERVSLADIVVACALVPLYEHVMDPAFRATFPNVNRWFDTCVNQPEFAEVIPMKEACKQRGKPRAGPSPASSSAKPAEKKKEDKPAAKKDDKPAAAAAAKKPAKDEEEPEEEVVEKKKTNPLDLLPPSSFVLDEFKRSYSNEDIRKVAAPLLMDKFDQTGYTAFWSTYKYNDELNMSFMTCNLVRGFFQRMDHMHKYGFGVVHIIGEEGQGKHEITAFWVFRGKGIPEVMKDVDDVELYNWVEIPDLKKEAAKITDYLANEDTLNGRPIIESRVFK